MKNKKLKWALIAVSCTLLASIARGCATNYNQTQATQTNKTTSIVNYIEQNEYFQKEINDFNANLERRIK